MNRRRAGDCVWPSGLDGINDKYSHLWVIIKIHKKSQLMLAFVLLGV